MAINSRAANIYICFRKRKKTSLAIMSQNRLTQTRIERIWCSFALMHCTKNPCASAYSVL